MGVVTDTLWCDSTVEIASGQRGRRLKANAIRSVLPAWNLTRDDRREDKPWLKDLPRIIRVGVATDFLAKEIPFPYIYDEVLAVADTERGRRNIFVLITTSQRRLAEFDAWMHDQGVGWPRNVWLGTRVRRRADLPRIDALAKIPVSNRVVLADPVVETFDLNPWLFCAKCQPPPMTWVEPHEEDLIEEYGAVQERRPSHPVRNKPPRWPIRRIEPRAICGCAKVQWVILGGDLTHDRYSHLAYPLGLHYSYSYIKRKELHAIPFNVACAANLMETCRAAGVAGFLTSLGRNPVSHYYDVDFSWARWVRKHCVTKPFDYKVRIPWAKLLRLKFNQPVSATPSEWHPLLRSREIPAGWDEFL